MNTLIGRFVMLGLVVLVLAGCCSSPTTQQSSGVPANPPASTAATAGQSAETALPSATDHGGAGHGGAPAADAPYDAQFIDSMITHHQGAIDMANQALKEAQQPEIKTLAQAIVKAQEAEIAQLRQWRQTWYPELPETAGMAMDMGAMMISADTGKPFDQRFIEAMIPHHEDAIAMAKDAQRIPCLPRRFAPHTYVSGQARQRKSPIHLTLITSSAIL